MDDEKRAQARPLENMSIPELESLLQQYFIISGPDDDPSVTEYMKKIAEVIMQKEEEAGIAEPSNVDGAWERFQNFYMEDAMDETSSDKIVPASPTMSRKGSRRTIRRTVLVAALIAVLLAMATIPVAGHRNFFEMIATWTEEQFTFRSAESTGKKIFDTDDTDASPQDGLQNEFASIGIDESENYETIQMALADYGIISSILPQTVPEGFEQLEVDAYRSSKGDVQFHSYYQHREGKFLTYDVIKHVNPSSWIYEKVDEDVKVHENVNHITFYLFSNIDAKVAVYYCDNLEISISTNLDESILKEIVDTISYFE